MNLHQNHHHRHNSLVAVLIQCTIFARILLSRHFSTTRLFYDAFMRSYRIFSVIFCPFIGTCLLSLSLVVSILNLKAYAHSLLCQLRNRHTHHVLTLVTPPAPKSTKSIAYDHSIKQSLFHSHSTDVKSIIVLNQRLFSKEFHSMVSNQTSLDTKPALAFMSKVVSLELIQFSLVRLF